MATADDLAGIPLFDALEPEEQAAIAPWLEVQDVSRGVKLVGEGATGYGEPAILGGGRRTASVTASAPAQVLVLFGTEFRRLEQEYPETAGRIESTLREIAARAA